MNRASPFSPSPANPETAAAQELIGAMIQTGAAVASNTRNIPVRIPRRIPNTI